MVHMLPDDKDKNALIGECQIVQAFLLSALDRTEAPASCPSCFITGENSLWIGAWLFPRAGLDDVEESDISVLIVKQTR
jgi:hypothetical protein